MIHDVIITARNTENFRKLSKSLKLTSPLKLEYISLSTKTCYEALVKMSILYQEIR